jgi:hypothetical protein
MSLMVEIVVNEMWFYHHLVKVLKDIYKCKNYILKILMTNLIGDYAYSGENALDLYHLFVNELDSKIVDGYLNIGSFLLRIRDNEKK